MVTDDGTEVAFHGEYRELIENERLVATEVFEGIPDGDAYPAVNTLTFTEKDGRTTLSLLTEAGSREMRDMIIDSGMEGGLQDALDLLEQVVISLN
jgi:uncharacterized protein YndB with AHSA1/START domain